MSEVRGTMTKEQDEWIELHGVTHCPPGPVVTMDWGGRSYGRSRAAELDEHAMICRVAMTGGVRALNGVDLNQPRIKRRKRCQLLRNSSVIAAGW